MSEDIIEISSGNLWADIGRPDAAVMFARAQLTVEIARVIRERGLTQVQAADVLGTSQPTVSDLIRGKIDKFSLERLIEFLRALGRDVELVVKTKELKPVELEAVHVPPKRDAGDAAA